MKAAAIAPLLLCAVACSHRAPEAIPIEAPGRLEGRLRSATTPRESALIHFKWRYGGREGRYFGDGAVRVNPPDSVRLDLLGPDWSGVQSAVVVGDDVRYVGEQRVRLPPPTFLWSMLGIFRPPLGVAPVGSRRGDMYRLSYRLSEHDVVAFEFGPEERLLRAEHTVDGHVVEEIRLDVGTDGPQGNGWRWPREARYRDLREYHEVRVEVTEARRHEPFDREIFRVVAR